jgi:hypothetical protein
MFGFWKKATPDLFSARPPEARGALLWRYPDRSIPRGAKLTVGLDETALFFWEGVLVGSLEAGSDGAATVFEPAVERALWDLAPVLLVGRITATKDGVAEEVRSFAPLDRAVLSAARFGAAPATHEAP